MAIAQISLPTIESVMLYVCIQLLVYHRLLCHAMLVAHKYRRYKTNRFDDPTVPIGFFPMKSAIV